MFCSIYRFIALYEVSNVRFMEYESLSLSLSTFSLSHNENRRSLPDSYLLRNDIQYRMDAWSIILTPLSAVLIKICQHWRASCKLVSIASKTGIPPWAGQPKMQSRTNMGIFHDRPTKTTFARPIDKNKNQSSKFFHRPDLPLPPFRFHLRFSQHKLRQFVLLRMHEHLQL